jgi:hypothetical protein
MSGMTASGWNDKLMGGMTASGWNDKLMGEMTANGRLTAGMTVNGGLVFRSERFKRKLSNPQTPNSFHAPHHDKPL